MWKTLRVILFAMVFLIPMAPASVEKSEVVTVVATSAPSLPVFETLTTETPTTVISTTTTSTTISHTKTASVKPSGNVWDVLAECESHGNWAYHGHFDGGLQFEPTTWTSYVASGKSYGLDGYPAYAYEASREQQITVAIRVRDGVNGSSDPYLNPQGWTAWPRCRHIAGV